MPGGGVPAGRRASRTAGSGAGRAGLRRGQTGYVPPGGGPPKPGPNVLPGPGIVPPGIGPNKPPVPPGIMPPMPPGMKPENRPPRIPDAAGPHRSLTLEQSDELADGLLRLGRRRDDEAFAVNLGFQRRRLHVVRQKGRQGLCCRGSLQFVVNPGQCNDLARGFTRRRGSRLRGCRIRFPYCRQEVDGILRGRGAFCVWPRSSWISFNSCSTFFSRSRIFASRGRRSAAPERRAPRRRKRRPPRERRPAAAADRRTAPGGAGVVLGSSPSVHAGSVSRPSTPTPASPAHDNRRPAGPFIIMTSLLSRSRRPAAAPRAGSAAVEANRCETSSNASA